MKAPCDKCGACFYGCVGKFNLFVGIVQIFMGIYMKSVGISRI